MLSANVSPDFINSSLSSPPIDTSRPIGDRYCFSKAKLLCQNLYFELDNKQDAMRKLLLSSN